MGASKTELMYNSAIQLIVDIGKSLIYVYCIYVPVFSHWSVWHPSAPRASACMPMERNTAMYEADCNCTETCMCSDHSNLGTHLSLCVMAAFLSRPCIVVKRPSSRVCCRYSNPCCT